MASTRTIDGLPAEIDLLNPDFCALQEALDRGAFSFSVNTDSKKGSLERRYELHIVPSDIPDFWRLSPKGDWYDPFLFKINEYGRIEAEDKGIFDRPDGVEPGFLFRGMSFEEFNESRSRGYLESRGGYNFEGQEGLTYFSKDADQAAYYASGFAPWQFKPTPSRPAVMVKIKDPGNHVIIPGTGENEVGLKGRIPFDSIVDILYAHPISITPGEIQIYEDRWKNQFVPGSSVGMMVSTTWNRNDVGAHLGAKKIANARLAIDHIEGSDNTLSSTKRRDVGP